MFIKAIVFVMCTIVGLTAIAIMYFLGYSILWMIRERMDEMEGEPGDLEIPWEDEE